MSTYEGSHIYTGPWINWSHGLVIGSTLTLSSRGGALLTSFLAAFITVVGSRLWYILTFLIHQARARRGPQDGLHHQQQNVFRNSQTPGGAAWKFFQQTYAWWQRASIFRSLPWALFSLLYLLTFAILSVFSGEVTKSTGTMRLIRSPECGYWRLEDNPTSNAAQLASFNVKNLNDTTKAAAYSRECYGGSSDTLQCGTMAAPSIPYSVNENATCPFGDDMCLMSNTAAFQINSTIDSHTLLGINAPKHHRVDYQKVTTCAPIHTKGYVTTENATGEDGSLGMKGDLIGHYNYGPFNFNSYMGTTNYTYSYNTHGAIDSIGYSVTALQAVTNAGVQRPFDPIPPLLKTYGDLSLIFIAFNSLRFVEPTYDPVFRATTSGGNITSHNETTSWWVADYYNSVVGCVDQHAICNPNRDGGICTTLGGASDFLNASTNAQYGFTPRQQGAIVRIANKAQFTNVHVSLAGRGASALRAQETVNQLDQGPLSDTHWMDEVTSWFTTGLAYLQRGVLEYASGTTNVQKGTYIWQPGDPVSLSMCRNQLVRSAQGTISFSVLGVAIILVIGGVIVLLSFILEPIVGCFQRRYQKGDYRRVQWMLDDALQLQRALYVERGWGTWDEGSWEASVPVCRKGQKFGGQEGPGVVGMVEGKGSSLPEADELMGGPLGKKESRIRVKENRGSRSEIESE